MLPSSQRDNFFIAEFQLSLLWELFFVGPFRGGNKPPVLLGVGNGRSKNKNGELKASRKAYTEEKPPSIIVNGLATALLKIQGGNSQ